MGSDYFDHFSIGLAHAQLVVAHGQLQMCIRDRDYTECGGLANLSDFFDEAKAKEYRDAAVEELTAAGVTFPIKILSLIHI